MKKWKYLSAAELRHASFTSFFVSVDEALRHEALMFLQRLTDKLFVSWDKSYGQVRTFCGLRFD